MRGRVGESLCFVYLWYEMVYSECKYRGQWYTVYVNIEGKGSGDAQ